MACCGGDQQSPKERQAYIQQKERSKEVELRMHQEHRNQVLVHKLLLLGGGESGKSTLFKQMVTIYGQGFPESERKTFRTVIYNNTINSMKTLCEQSEFYADMEGKTLKSKQFIEDLKGDEEIDENVCKHMKRLWKDEAIQTTYENRAHFQLTDSASYFFDKLDELASPGYIPTHQDVLRCRVRTTGIVENNFVIEGNHFKIFDVGGQRNERKKWIHCFEDVTAVMFVVALSEYDQVLYEDDNTNRIVEALNLFDEICNSRWFSKTSIMLFLNKKDLFEEKLKRVPLTCCFSDYKGNGSFEDAAKYMAQQFQARNRRGQMRMNAGKSPAKIYTHITCATDTDNVATVFNTVKDIVIRLSISDSGLE